MQLSVISSWKSQGDTAQMTNRRPLRFSRSADDTKETRKFLDYEDEHFPLYSC